MSDWSEGYVKGIDYTYGYYPELNPARSNFALLKAGFAPLSLAGSTACELGFGFGVSSNIHAAASTVQWWGTDFNPAHTQFARELAQASGAGCRFFDESFADFCHRRDLPEFDFVVLHGIWSWVSEKNRKLLVAFLRKRLRVGGVLYISYNTQPGWAQSVPLRQLMIEHAETISPAGLGIGGRIEAAVTFAQKLFEASPTLPGLHPLAAGNVKRLQEYGHDYLAHEYFNRDWHPVLFSDLARQLETAKLSFVASADYLDAFDHLNLTAPQMALLEQLPSVRFRQSARDFMVNRQFRRDYWIKGGRHLAADARNEALRRQRVILLTPAQEVSLTGTGLLGEFKSPEAIFNPILEALAHGQPVTLAQLEAQVTTAGVRFELLADGLAMLMAKGDVVTVQEEGVVAQAARTATALNHHLVQCASHAVQVTTLASPVTGGGIQVPESHLQLLLARSNGITDPQACGAFLWQYYQRNGSRLVKEGQTLFTAEENIAELADHAQQFHQTRLPLLERFQALP